MCEIEVEHEELGRHRLILGPDPVALEQKAAAILRQWSSIWTRQQRWKELTSRRWHIDADDLNDIAGAELDGLRNLLRNTLAISHRIDWSALKENSDFDEPPPTAPTLEDQPPEPPLLPAHKHRLNLLERLVPQLKQLATESFKGLDDAIQEENSARLEEWRAETKAVKRRNAAKLSKHKKAVDTWEQRRSTFVSDQTERLRHINMIAKGAAENDEGSISAALSIALSRAPLPDIFSADFNVEYLAASQSCVIDCVLPAPDDLPKIKSVKLVRSRDKISEKMMSELERGRLYDDLLYQAALHTLHVAFEADTGRFVERITFNGWVDYIHRATGMDERSCILTVGANRADLERIDLGRVDPRECFRSLKGVAASKLIGLAAVAPLARPRITDSRFVASEDIAGGMEAGINVAAMDWQEFEHLVRQVFENEFAAEGTEVRVTQASRDGGVDAIVFDPDPIRGGKIVIQAKRYTNTVEVGAVRDLYGTVLNEGASKGILVTTSQFGPDARKFAQGKPLTLIDGGNFLHLLERIGMKARIDLREAKATLSAVTPPKRNRPNS